MRRINWMVFMLLLGFSACIKPFEPEIDSSEINKYVVSGCVTDSVGWQTVEVSFSSPVGAPEYIPVQFCQVAIQDDKGHEFQLVEFLPGKYRVWMDDENLNPGTAYRVVLTTPKGDYLVSVYDTMPKGPRVDSVYYKVQDEPTTDPAVSNRIMQFYADLDARGDYSDYYKWEVTETWEFNAAHPVEYYYDGTHHTVKPPDYTNFTCWAIKEVKNVFTVSVNNLSEKRYLLYPLHKIDGYTARLGIMYSILVKQQALSQAAYNYWEQLRKNNNDQGGLYEKQPVAVKGNVENSIHPEQIVLGYFYAASQSNRRYFYTEVEGIELKFDNFCFQEPLYVGGFSNYAPQEYPVYYYYYLGSVRVIMHECVDCRLLGGTTTKPDYWPR